jgi:hypothetical protein
MFQVVAKQRDRKRSDYGAPPIYDAHADCSGVILRVVLGGRCLGADSPGRSPRVRLEVNVMQVVSSTTVAVRETLFSTDEELALSVSWPRIRL